MYTYLELDNSGVRGFCESCLLFEGTVIALGILTLYVPHTREVCTFVREEKGHKISRDGKGWVSDEDA